GQPPAAGGRIRRRVVTAEGAEKKTREEYSPPRAREGAVRRTRGCAVLTPLAFSRRPLVPSAVSTLLLFLSVPSAPSAVSTLLRRDTDGNHRAGPRGAVGAARTARGGAPRPAP